MTNPVSIEVRGLKETQAKMVQVVRDLSGSPMLQAMGQSTLLVMGDARRAAPVDTGRLRASIVPEVRMMGNVVQGVVGSNLAYAPAMELGTGTFVGKAPHYPPVWALVPWVHRKQIAGTYSTKTRRRTGSKIDQWTQDIEAAMMISLAIGRRGGLRPRRFLEMAFLKNRDKIAQLFGTTVGRIVAR